MRMKRNLAIALLSSCLAYGFTVAQAAVTKSVQRGTATFASGQNTLPVTLTAVDTTKTIVWGGINWGGGRNSSSDPRDTRVGFQLADSTTLNLQRLGSPTQGTVVEWQAIEFASGASVQRGTTSFATTNATLNVPITAVNLSESFVLVSVATAQSGNPGRSTDERWTIRARLTSTTNLELSRNETGTAITVYWQVVSLSGASVQRGLTSIAAGAASATATISSVNLTNTFLLLTQQGAGASNGIESEYMVRGRITSDTQLTIDRISTTNSVDIAWEVVSFTDGSSVQSGSIPVASANFSGTATLTNISLARSASFINVRGGTGTATTSLDETAFTHSLINSTTLAVTRGGTGTTADVSWFVIQFANQPPVLTVIGSKSTNENQLLQFRVSATDADSITPSLSAVGLPTGANFVDSTNGAGGFSWTPSFTQSGIYNVTFITSDGSLADSEVVTITVNDVNQAPALASIGPKSVNEGQTLQFRFSATDPDGTIPSLTVVNNPTNSSFVDSANAAGSFTFSPDFTQGGVFNVTFIASDTLGGADTEVVAITVNNVNRAPVLDSIGPKSVNEGQSLQFRVHATDADADSIIFTTLSAPTNSTFVDSGNGAGSLTFNPDFTQSGPFNVTFIASDTLGGADSEVVAITVNNVNRPPVLDSIGPRNVTEGNTLSFRVTFSDPDGTIPSFVVVNNPANSSFADSSNGAGSFTFNPDFTQAGLHNVTFIASDGSLSDTEIVAITVSEAGNQAPVLAAIGSKSVTEGQTLQFRFAATDPDGTTPTLTVVNNPANSSFFDSTNGAGSFTFNPDFTQANVYNVTFIASDGTLADSETVTIIVNEAGNQAPVLATIGPKSVTEEQTLTFRFSATDPDGTTPSLTVVNNPANSSFFDSTNGAGSFTFSPDFTQANIYNVTFIASDGSLADSETVVITVTEAGNQRPVLAAIGPQSVNEGQTLTFRISATDADGTFPSFTVVNNPANSNLTDSLNGAGSFTFTPDFTQAGVYNVTFIASDGSLADSELVTITVSAVNQAPVLAFIGPQSITEGQTLQFRFSATDPDGTTPSLTVVNNPANSSFFDSTNGAGSFTFSPDFTQANVYNVTFIASDGSLADTEIVAITVNEAGNQRPVLDSIGPKTIAEGQTLQFRIHASDLDETFPTLTVVNNPANSSFFDSTNGAGSFTFSPDFTQANVYNLTFIASDGSLSDTEVVAITVNEAGNQAPVLALIGPKFISEGQTLSFKVSASDLDGTIPNLFAANLPANSNFLDSLNGSGAFIFNPNFTQAGVYNVKFLATDGALVDSEIVQITVLNVNQPPVLDSIGPKTVAEGSNLNFRVTASDVDGNSNLFLTAQNLPANASFVDSGNGIGRLNFNPDFTQSGVYNLTFKVTDLFFADSEIVQITVTEGANRAPVLDPIGFKIVTEGNQLQFRVHATDPDGTTPQFKIFGSPRGAVFVDSGNGAGSFTWTPDFAQAGLYNVKFSATDGQLKDDENVLIQVKEAGNQRPVLLPIGPQSITEGQILNTIISAADPDSTIPQLFADSLPVNASFLDLGTGNANFVFAPEFVQAGSYNLLFWTSDGSLADSELITITVLEAGNQTPQWITLPDSFVISENTTGGFNVKAADPDSTNPILRAGNLPLNSAFVDSANGRGRFSFSPNFDQQGTYFVNFFAKDSADSLVFALDSVKVIVKDINRKPVFTQGSISDKTVNEGDSLIIDVSAADPDGTIPVLNFRAENASFVPITLANASFTDNGNGTGQFKFKPNYIQAGVYFILFYAVDQVYSADTTFLVSNKVRITVNNTNRAPIIQNVNDTSFTEGDSLVLTLIATDPDLTIPTLTAQNLPTNATFAPNNANGTGKFKFKPVFNQAGVYAVSFRATDGSLVDTEIVNITVIESGNHSPLILTSIPDSIIAVPGKTYNLSISAADPDSTIPTLVAQPLPNNATFVDSGNGKGSFQFIPDSSQVDSFYGIQFKASDGILQDLDTLNILVINFIRGDCDGNGRIELADVVYLINHIFLGGPAPIPPVAGDANANGSTTLADVIYLANYLFKGGPPPPP